MTTRTSVIKVAQLGRTCHVCNGEIKRGQKFMSSGTFKVYGNHISGYAISGYAYVEHGSYVNTCKKCLRKLSKEADKK